MPKKFSGIIFCVHSAHQFAFQVTNSYWQQWLNNCVWLFLSGQLLRFMGLWAPWTSKTAEYLQLTWQFSVWPMLNLCLFFSCKTTIEAIHGLMSQVIKDKLFNQINIAWSASPTDMHLQSRESHSFFCLDLLNLRNEAGVENYPFNL